MRFERGFTDFYDISEKGTLGKIKRILKYGLGTLDKGATKINKELMKWLTSNYQSPFFTYLHYDEMHVPFRLTKHFRDIFLDSKFFMYCLIFSNLNVSLCNKVPSKSVNITIFEIM